MSMGAFGAGLGAVMNLGTTLINNDNNRKMQRNAYYQQRNLNQQAKDLAFQQWKDTNFQAQRKELEKAGLSTGLLYGMGGAGGATANTGSGGSAPNYMPSQISIGLDPTTLAQVELMQAQTKKTEAEAENIGAKTTTENDSRATLIENMRQSGIAQWLENEEQQFKRTNNQYSGENAVVDVIKNKVYNESTTFDNKSYSAQQFNADLLKTMAEKENLDANAILTNKKAQGYWMELMQGQMHADADKVRAAAQKLATEHGTGEYTNWKTWADLSMKAVETISSLKGFKNNKPADKSEHMEEFKDREGGTTRSTYTKYK